MEIKASNPYSLPVNTAPIKANPNLWQAGQLVKAVIVNLENNNLILQVIQDNIQLKLTTRSHPTLQLGQTLDLQVIKGGTHPKLELMTVLEKSNALNVSETIKNIVNFALRQIVPKQTSLAPLLANLHYLSHPKPVLNQQFPQQILDLSRSLFQHLPAPIEIQTAQGLKKAINSSGIFLEQQLAQMIEQNTQLNEKDVRVSLLRLAQALRSYSKPTSALHKSAETAHSNQLTIEKTLKDKSLLNPPITTIENTLKKTLNGNTITKQNQSDYFRDMQQIKPNSHTHPRLSASLAVIQQTTDAIDELFRHVESSLLRIQLNQLQQLIPDDSGKTNWIFELPVRKEDGSDIFHFIISRDNHPQDSEYERPWSISLSFDLQQLGPVRVQLSLINTKINVLIWAEHQNTYLLFQQHMKDLQLKLENSGLQIANFNCFCGIPEEIITTTKTSILDEKV